MTNRELNLYPLPAAILDDLIDRHLFGELDQGEQALLAELRRKYPVLEARVARLEFADTLLCSAPPAKPRRGASVSGSWRHIKTGDGYEVYQDSEGRRLHHVPTSTATGPKLDHRRQRAKARVRASSPSAGRVRPTN